MKKQEGYPMRAMYASEDDKGFLFFNNWLFPDNTLHKGITRAEKYVQEVTTSWGRTSAASKRWESSQITLSCELGS